VLTSLNTSVRGTKFTEDVNRTVMPLITVSESDNSVQVIEVPHSHNLIIITALLKYSLLGKERKLNKLRGTMDK
jgi:hypothetical protein